MIETHIVDDHPISRWGLQRALESATDIRVTAMFASADEALSCWCARKPDVALVDLYLGDDGPSLRFVAQVAHSCRVIIISASRRPADVAACRRAGATGFVHKSCDAAALVAAVHACVAGGQAFPDAEPDPHLAALTDLSPRERQVLAHIASGYTHDQTARRLEVSRHTVDTYVKRLRAKVGWGNKAYLTRLAVDAGVTLDAEHLP